MRGIAITEPLNRGAQNTEQRPFMESLIDWCSFTVPDRKALEEVFSVIGIPLKSFILIPKWKNYYKVQQRCGHIIILSDGMPGMGIHIEMSGQGCREFDASSGRWRDLFSKVFAVGGHFGRIDAAIDDHKGHFTLDELHEKMKRREVRSCFRKGRSIDDYDLTDKSAHDGKTLYFGSPKSKAQIKIYNKAAEQGGEGVWIRTEVVCRNKRAHMIARLICDSDNLGGIIGGILKKYLNFIEPSTDLNKARWPVSSWWDNFLGTVERVKLSIMKKVKQTIQRAKNWIQNQVAPSLALYLMREGGDIDSFVRLATQGEKCLKPHQRAMLGLRTKVLFSIRWGTNVE